MKKNVLLIVPILFLSISCVDDDALPQIENITSGKKWTLEIGSSPIEVYGQLQELGIEKNFNNVAITYRQPYTKPNEIQSDISLYQAITLETNSGVLERVLIQFNQDKVISIEAGNALLEPITNWPQNLPNNTSININDPLDIILQKLTAIYQIPEYQKYQIILPDKWLAKPYDPDMQNYNEWAFTFSENISSSKDGRNSVRLYFNNNKLVKIRNEYEEFNFAN